MQGKIGKSGYDALDGFPGFPVSSLNRYSVSTIVALKKNPGINHFLFSLPHAGPIWYTGTKRPQRDNWRSSMARHDILY